MSDKSFIIIIAVLFLSNTIYGLASPFLPVLLESRGIKETWTGLIFASYAIAYCIMAPIIGMLIDKVRHNRIMALGILLMSLSIASFGFGIYIESNEGLVAVAITLRMCQGKFFKIADPKTFIRHRVMHDQYVGVLVRSASIRRKHWKICFSFRRVRWCWHHYGAHSRFVSLCVYGFLKDLLHLRCTNGSRFIISCLHLAFSEESPRNNR